MSQAGQAGNANQGGHSTTVAVSTFQPNVVLQEFDDFLSTYAGGTGIASKLNWQSLSGNLIASAGTITNPGIISAPASAGNVGIVTSQLNSSAIQIGDIVLGGGITTVTWIIKLSALSAGGNTYRFSAGLADGPTTSSGLDSFTDGVYFQYTNAVNGGQWTIKSTSGSVTTTVNTAIAASTSFVTLSFAVNANASSITYSINNTVVGTAITTNIPTVSLAPFFIAKNLSGTTPEMLADLFYIDIALTTPRPGPTFSQAVVGTGQLVEQYVGTAISYQVLNTDAIIGVTSTAAVRTITMPASSLVTGQRWTVKDESGGAAANNIIVSGNGKNIDAAASYSITTNYGAVDLYYNGTQFYLI
jgi:hypothetical protein